jgi:hypothetical protein
LISFGTTAELSITNCLYVQKRSQNMPVCWQKYKDHVVSKVFRV